MKMYSDPRLRLQGNLLWSRAQTETVQLDIIDMLTH
jgi:hypothetical protein